MARWIPGIELASGCAWVLCLVATCAGAQYQKREPPHRAASFQQDIAPILFSRCQGCHGPLKSKGKFRLDSFERLMKPGSSKAAPVVPGDPEKSELFRLITTADDDDRMPKKGGRLPAGQVLLIRQWIEGGARFDGIDPSATLASLVSEQEHPDPPDAYARPVPITALAFSPDGKELAVGGYHEITLWDAATGQLLGRIKRLPERTQSVAYSPDGRLLAAATGTPGKLGEIILCDPQEHAPGRVLDTAADQMLCLSFSPDGRRLAAGGSDNAVRIFDIADGKLGLTIEQHADWVTDVAFSPDGTRLASASRDKSARVFDAATGATLSAYLGHEEAVFGVAWTDDGKRVWSVGKDRKIHIWSAADAKPIAKIAEPAADAFGIRTGLGFVFTCSSDGVVRQYSQEKRELVRAFPAFSDWVYRIAIDPKDRRIAAGGYNGQVCVYDLNDGRKLADFIAAPGYAGRGKNQ